MEHLELRFNGRRSRGAISVASQKAGQGKVPLRGQRKIQTVFLFEGSYDPILTILFFPAEIGRCSCRATAVLEPMPLLFDMLQFL
jgi:hypothetical protein